MTGEANHNALQTITAAPAAELTRLMTPTVNSVLAGDYWTPAQAKDQLEQIRADPAALAAVVRSALAPVPKPWLAARLRLMWESHPVSAGIKAKSWLHETGRLLCDLPQDIVSDAIDEAVCQSERGFMPAVGEIRAIADPKVRARNSQLWRLEQVIAHEPARKVPTEERCTPEEARRIREELGIQIPEDGPRKVAMPEWMKANLAAAQVDRNPEGGDGTAPSRSDESAVGAADAPELACSCG